MSYIDRILDAFYGLRIEDVPEDVMHQVRRCLIDYMGCTAYTAEKDLCAGIIETVKSISRDGESTIWGRRGARLCMEAAAFANAARTSNIELDDVSGIGASVHPGVYVWSAAFAAAEKYNPDPDTVIRAVLFGYDLCLRMGLLSTENVRKLGLHGPGLNGAFAALATGGMIAGLTKEEMRNAIGIAGSLLPVCPFISFMSGDDSKDYYGGWGTYLGLVAVNSAKRGLTGPEGILDGSKSLKSIYSGKEAEGEIARDFLIMKLSFKEFSACASVHPAMSALLALLAEHPFNASDVESVEVETYPYSYQLNSGVMEPLNVSSARLSLPYTVSVCIETGALLPDAFLPESLSSGKYGSLMDRVRVYEHKEYGDSSFSIRGAIVRVALKDGTRLEKEAIGSRWSKGVSDEDLVSKFRTLSSGAFSKEDQDRIAENAFAFDGDLGYFIEALSSIGIRS
ncbi:MAG: MmgE/PrpD family protein [Candidatus Ornithospirochaeta sp.]|nr:MmgE/PrpD family protein [Candidatus Ornithospirochaeta sp.]